MDKVDFCDTVHQVTFDTFFSKFVAVYYKRQEDPPGSCSPCGESLVTFMQRVCQTLDAQHSKQFLHSFLEGVTAEMWSGAALVHLVRALSHMPRAPLIGGATLAFLRKIIINTMSTMQVYYFTARKRSCGKVMFLHQSVCSQGDGLASEHTSQVRWPEKVACLRGGGVCLRGICLGGEGRESLQMILRDLFLPQW